MLKLVFFWGVVAFLVAFLLTSQVKRLARAWNLVDVPDGERRLQVSAVPLLGGLAVYLSICVCLFYLLLNSHVLTQGAVDAWVYVGILLGGMILMLVGVLDDRLRLPAKWTILAPVAAALVVLFFGINIEKLTNPFGGVVYLALWQSHLLVFVWLLVMMYTTKFLDGIDGLSTSISSVAIVMMLCLALSQTYFQPDMALLAGICFGACLGFLVWNRPPALLYLGEGGSTFLGFMVGVLAVMSGAKLAIALLVLVIPLFDLGWSVARRWYRNGFKAVVHGDRRHLHHRLQDIGWSDTRIVITYTITATVFGLVALTLQSQQKLVALVVLFLLVALFTTYLCLRTQKSS